MTLRRPDLRKWTVLSSTSRSGLRNGRLLGALLLASFAVAALLVPGAPSFADDAATGDAIGVASRPAGTDGRPDGRTRFEYTTDPGQTVTDQVLVGNTGTEPQDFTVYATDAYNAANGDFSLLATAEKPQDLGTWVKFDGGQSRVEFSLAPDEVRLLTFTVSFPADATPGDHVGGIVASVLEKSDQVSVDRRVATAMFARVSGELQPRLTLGSIDATYQGEWWNPFSGTVKVLYTVDNPGNVALAANLSASVATWFGIPASATQGAGVPMLLPGNSASYEVDLPGVAQWGYLAPRVDLSPFVESQDAARQVLAVAVSRDTVVLAVPWALVILIALIGGVVYLVRWRRRRDQERAQEWIAYTEQKAAEAAAAAAAPVEASVGTTSARESTP